MTIDAIISMFTFEATKKCKDYQIKTIQAIDYLAQVKEKYKNDFDLFLLGETVKNLDSIKECEGIVNNIKNNGYGLFLKVVELKCAENDAVSQNEKNAFIAKFVSDKKTGSQIYTEIAKDFVGSQASLTNFLGKLEDEFIGINADLDKALGHISKKENDKQIVALANIHRYLEIDANPFKILQSSFNQKVKELNISKERLLANDITYLKEEASKEVEGMQRAGFIGHSASQYTDAINRSMAMNRADLMKKAVKKEHNVQDQKIEMEEFLMIDYRAISKLKDLQYCALNTTKTKENKKSF